MEAHRSYSILNQELFPPNSNIFLIYVVNDIFLINSTFKLSDFHWIYVPLRLSSQSSSVPTSFNNSVALWNVPHSLVFCLWSDKHQVHPGVVKRTAHLSCSIIVHGFRSHVLDALCGHLRLIIFYKDSWRENK